MKVSVLLLCFALMGCATEAKFVTKITPYVGQPESAIILKMGPPDRTHQLADGTRILQWRVSRTINMVLPGGTTPVQTTTTGQVGGFGGNSFEATSTTYSPKPDTVIPLEQACTLNVTIDPKGIMTAWSASGNHCKSN